MRDYPSPTCGPSIVFANVYNPRAGVYLLHDGVCMPVPHAAASTLHP